MFSSERRPAWHLFVPKSVTVLRQGYGLAEFRADFVAGLTVAIVALPLAMALAIASGTTPDKGLLTAVVAGFIISALGGSRFQIGGPTGAFVVVVFNIIQQFGYDGLVLATLMAGMVLLAAGIAKLGTWIKYIPEPVVTGFTSGIAVIIFSSQIRDLFGLTMAQVPAEFAAKWLAFWDARYTLRLPSALISAAALLAIVGLRRWAPKAPAFLVAVVGAAAAVYLLGLPGETIGSKFGGIPSSLPAPVLPEISLARIVLLLPSALTIAFLAGVESLLSAVVADGMTGRRHRSNCELVAQGVANVASALFGGMPATGAIARTATSIRSGARSPVAGMLHAVFILLFMLLLAPLAAYVPLASLAAVLVIVAWNMSEVRRFIGLMSAPVGDRIVLVVTFLLTVFVDLTVAIEVGVVLAAILFMHRMSEAVAFVPGAGALVDGDIDDFSRPNSDRYTQRENLPAGVEVFKISGPLFFGVAGRLMTALDRVVEPPGVFIVRMRDVPFLDSSGAGALKEFVARCDSLGTKVILSGIQPAVRITVSSKGLGPMPVHFASGYAEALLLAKALVGAPLSNSSSAL